MDKKHDDKRPTKSVRVATASLNAHIVGSDGRVSQETVKSEKARELLAIHDETCDADYLEAAHVLIPRSRNRPTAGDALKLRRMLALIERGYASSDHEAARIVAADDPGHSIEATIDRLRRKMKRWRRRGFRGKPPT